MKQWRLYKTVTDRLGNYLDMEALFITPEYAGELISKSGEVNEKGQTILYTKEPMYYTEEYQRSLVYHIVNANNYKTYSDFINGLKTHYPEYYLNLIDKKYIAKEFNAMRNLILDGESCYPDVKRIILVNKGKTNG